MRHIRPYLHVAFCLALALQLMFAACSRSASASADRDGRQVVEHARYLRITDCDGYSIAEVSTPWSDGKPVATYRIDRPLDRSVVYSAVHTAAIDELGAIARVAGVADASFFVPGDTVTRLLAAGRIADIGSSMAPMVEKIIDLDCDGVLLSAMEEGVTPALSRSGVPVFIMADYLEETPLARAEWIKFLGRLYGNPAAADSIYAAVCDGYEAVAARIRAVSSFPKVMTEKPYTGVWYVPGGNSYMARLIGDAGGNYAWSDDTSTGSLALDEAAVIDRAADADIWLIRDSRDLTADGLLAEVPHARAFASFPGGVYWCNTVAKPFFNAVAFHPELILAEYARIFHPNMFPDCSLNYFRKLQ